MNIFKCDFPKVAFLQLVDMISRKVIDQLTKVIYQNLWKTCRYRLTRAFWIFSISRIFTAVLDLENIEIFFFLVCSLFPEIFKFCKFLVSNDSQRHKKTESFWFFCFRRLSWAKSCQPFWYTFFVRDILRSNHGQIGGSKILVKFLLKVYK